MVEPTACAVHAARRVAAHGPLDTVAVIGAGTLGLLTIAALRHASSGATIGRILATGQVPPPEGSGPLARRRPGGGARRTGPRGAQPHRRLGRDSTGGEGSSPTASTWWSTAWAAPPASPRPCRWSPPAARCSWSACPATPALDLTTPLAPRDRHPRLLRLHPTRLRGRRLGGGRRRPRRLVSATYPLARYTEAIEHAATAGARGAVKVAFDLRAAPVNPHSPSTKDRTLMPRPGFVLDVDARRPADPVPPRRELPPREAARRSQPGDLPAEPLEALDDVDGAIRHALLHPHEQDPLPAQLFPGMKLTIAFDDVSCRCRRCAARHPPARHRSGARHGGRRRRRRRAPHRRARPAPPHDRVRAAPRRRRPHLRRVRPARHALQPRRRRPRQPGRSSAPPTTAKRWRSTSGPPTATCSSTSTSTSCRWTAAGRAPPPAWPATAASSTTTTCRRMEHSKQLHGPPPSELHHSNWRLGKVLADAGPKIFQIETTLNNDTFGRTAPCRLPGQARVGVDRRDRATFMACQKGLNRTLRSSQPPQDLPQPPGALRRSPRCRPATSRPCTDHPGALLRPAPRGGRPARPTSSPWASPTSARTT
jgi:hypothetical protein